MSREGGRRPLPHSVLEQWLPFGEGRSPKARPWLQLQGQPAGWPQASPAKGWTWPSACRTGLASKEDKLSVQPWIAKGKKKNIVRVSNPGPESGGWAPTRKKYDGVWSWDPEPLGGRSCRGQPDRPPDLRRGRKIAAANGARPCDFRDFTKGDPEISVGN